MKANATTAKSAGINRILVVGDWVVDEHWVTGVHRSPTSSRTGRSHYRTLHGLKSTTQSLCAAGQTASILYKSSLNSRKFCEILGIGIWHRDDTDELTLMLDPENVRGQTPHRITRSLRTLSVNAKLCNLSDTLGTTRVIRTYQHTGSQIELLQRTDWELQYAAARIPTDRLEQFLIGTELDAIVIKDICKGVLSEELVGWLVGRFPQVPWFVSTKAWSPDWLKEIENLDVRLLMIPQVSAQTALRENKLTCWFARSRYVSKDAIKQLDELASRFSNPTLLVVLPDEMSLIARYAPNHNPTGIVQALVQPITLPVGVAMASVFFPALTSSLLHESHNVEEALKKSLSFTSQWMLFEAGRVERPDSWDPKDAPIFRIESEYALTGQWHTFPWQHAKEVWDRAFSEYAITTKNDKKRIELWRAMTEVDGYVCCVEAKRNVLRRLVSEIESFKSKAGKVARSCLLTANPGSGKSFLVRCLAKSVGMRHLSFNITQMLSKNDILHCFDTIVTTQAQNPSQPILVFIDEINTSLDGQHVYDMFLAPLEESVYSRAGNTFHIAPCFWFFAGTEDIGTSDDPHGDRTTKASDFKSRLTVPPQDFRFTPKNAQETAQLQTERVYLGVRVLRSTFPDVRRVSEKVLRVFHGLDTTLEARDIAHFVRSFEDIQYGEVRSKNVSIPWLSDRWSFDIIAWSSSNEGDIVEIIG